MKTKAIGQSKKRMIHIRLDKNTHKRLKIEAVQKDTTVQYLVETLIIDSLGKSRAKDVT